MVFGVYYDVNPIIHPYTCISPDSSSDLNIVLSDLVAVMLLMAPQSITDAVEKYASQTGLTTNQFSLALGLGAAALASFSIYLTSSGKKDSTRYGPGPKGVPILGNAIDLPKTDDYKVYTEWAKKYGEP